VAPGARRAATRYDPARKTRHLLARHRDFGEFKVPGLRHVARTAPCLHDGQKATLEAVIDHDDRLSLDRLHADGEQILRPLQLGGSGRADLLAFLRSLDGGAAPASGAGGSCRTRRHAGPETRRPRGLLVCPHGRGRRRDASSILA